MKYLLIIFLSIALLSCKDAQVDQHISAISNMNSELTDIETELNEKRVDSISIICANVRGRILKIKQNYSSDTIPRIRGEQINQYKEIRKVLPKNTKLGKKISKAIEEERESLSNLEHDITNGVNDREKYAQFIQDEQTKVKQIKTLMASFLETQDKYITRYTELDPIMAAFVQELLLAKETNE